MDSFDFLLEERWGNPVQDYLIAAGVFLGGLLVLGIIKQQILRRLARWASHTETEYDDIVIECIERFLLPILSGTLFFYTLKYLHLSDTVYRVTHNGYLVFLIYFIVRVINFLIVNFITSTLKQRNESVARIKEITSLLIIVKIFVWVFGLFVLLSNLGFNVTAIVTGLGVGGVAIAFAAQNLLSNLFSYFIIFFDKPFQVGEFIVVKDISGDVEKIGFFSSHIRSLSGQLTVMPNAEIVKSIVHNYKRMEKRRIVFVTDVDYATPPSVLRTIPTWIETIVKAQSPVQFDRCHLKELGDFSLQYETVYFVLSPEYNVYMNIQQEINLNIIEKLQAENVQIPFPTQTVSLKK